MGALGRLGLAIVGNTLGGPWGGLIGGVIGAYVFPDQLQDVHSEGPKLNDFKFTGSSYGAGIPWVWGNYAVPGNVIWLGEVHRHSHTEEEDIGGKGGGGATSSYTTYTYSLSFAQGLCKGEMHRVLKVFMDNQLVYDALSTKIGDKVVDPSFRFYSGSETQLPDSVMEAKEGAGNVPGYRGLCYLVFDELDITPFGNRIPQIKVVIQAVNAGANLPETTFSTETYAEAGGSIYDIERSLSFYANSFQDDTVTVMDLTGPRSIVASYEIPYTTYGGARGVFGDDFYTIKAIDGTTAQVNVFDSMTGAFKLSGRPLFVGGGWGLTGSAALSVFPVSYASLDGEIRHIAFVSVTQLNMGASNPQGTIAQWLEAPDLMPDNLWAQKPLVEKMNSYFCFLPTKSNQNLVRALWLHVHAKTTSTVDWTVMDVDMITVQDLPDAFGNLSPSVDVKHIGTVSASDLNPANPPLINDDTSLGPHASMMDGLVYDESNDTVIVSAWSRKYIVCMTMGGQILWQFTNDDGGIIIGAQAMTYEVMNHEIRDSTLPIVGDPDHDGAAELRLLDTKTGTLLPAPPQNDIPIIGQPFGYISNADVLTMKRGLLFIDRSDFVEVPVADIITPLTAEVHGAPNDFTDVAGLTVNGYGMAHPMSARDAIAPIARLYQFDAVDAGGTLRWVRRGQPAVAQVPRDDLVVSDSADGAQVVSRTRTQEVELPQAVSVTYADRTRDYETNTAYAQRFTGNEGYETMRSRNKAALEVPAAILGDIAKRFAEINLMSAWNERTAMKFSLPPYGLLYDPGDSITLDIPGRFPEDVMVLKQTIGANLQIDVDSVSQDSAQYVSVVVADQGSGYVPPEVAMATHITAIPLPITLPADSFDTNRTTLIVAMTASSTQAFARPIIVGRLRTDGTYEVVGSITKAATQGAVMAEFAGTDPASEFCFQPAATLNVRVILGTLQPVSHAQLLAGANTAAIIRPDGTAELLQFEAATLTADKTYTLSGLIRGRRGTDYFARSAAPSGSRFVLLASDSVITLDEPLAGFGNFETLRLWYDGTDPAKGTTIRVPVLGRELMPYAPVHVDYTRAGNNDHTISWVRRTRVGGDLVPFTGDVALGEDTEAYEVDVSDGYTTKTYPVATPAYTYTEVQRLADGMHNGYGATVYQMSGQVGRGFPSRVITTPTRADVSVLSIFKLGKPTPRLRVAELAPLIVKQDAAAARATIFAARVIKKAL